MSLNYNNLWKLLIDKDLKRTDLINLADISSNVLARMGKNEPVSLESLEKICIALDCSIQDVLTIEKGE
ncbi:helix-turn-helix domain-containing protein [Moraxella catarrhalis]|uniref:Cro/C1-type HTH DNA-binding domain protein n=1 Tax=Moraxella catarrhalis TaxID=480 RepID=A0ABY0BK56_MORCA|nr:helix-turn-helix transcriptional regulator [Moraxella catarrhalis]ARB66867.1 XRE family transcriptional regulator [Moraxella catarrhalis]EGE17394.1 putative regulatory protein [Moraxella catarrhalis 12P80B1]EGE18301.1 putative regulatory protein [Moraxella catarrhalis BC8]KZR95138.1 Cro/Cl family transcriptional regulator [Moraxella catarrhalis]MCG6820228.1 helix-turn-helix transcriptional regulator [Moraxella catarrhalis]